MEAGRNERAYNSVRNNVDAALQPHPNGVRSNPKIQGVLCVTELCGTILGAGSVRFRRETLFDGMDEANNDS